MTVQTVWKFSIDLGSDEPVLMPKGAQVLHVDNQDGALCVWALVDPHAPKVARGFVVVGTGHPVPAFRGRFLGTVLFAGGALVFHVWEDLRP